MNRARGFTLVELMVTLAVLGILAGIAVPYLLTSLPNQRVGGAVRQMVADFRLAKTIAVEKGKDVFIQFHSPATNQYTVSLDSDDSHDVSVGDEVLKTVDVPAVYSSIELGSSDPASLPDGVTFSGNLAIFHPGGGADAGRVFFRPAQDGPAGRRDRDRMISVTVSTGRPKAFAWRNGAWE